MFGWLGSINKAIASAIGVGLTVATAITGLGFLAPGSAQDTAAIVIAVLTPLATYVFPNKPKPAE